MIILKNFVKLELISRIMKVYVLSVYEVKLYEMYIAIDGTANNDINSRSNYLDLLSSKKR